MSKKRACKCPLCNSKFIPADLGTAIEHMALGVITVFKGLQTKAEDEVKTDNPLPCPRCGHVRMAPVLMKNPMSRHADVHICDICAVDEAARDISDSVLPITSWWAVREILSAYKPEQTSDDTQDDSEDDTED